MATSAMDREFIEAVAAEITMGIDTAVAYWISRIESVFQNPRLTTLGRLQAIQVVVAEYKVNKGKVNLETTRGASATCSVP
ncbi:MAG TPA: hypothetical protein VFA89_06195 [Terriglobales bacterium]|nr:hypothetical protein [Terriglobales bacterium]